MDKMANGCQPISMNSDLRFRKTNIEIRTTDKWRRSQRQTRYEQKKKSSEFLYFSSMFSGIAVLLIHQQILTFSNLICQTVDLKETNATNRIRWWPIFSCYDSAVVSHTKRILSLYTKNSHNEIFWVQDCELLLLFRCACIRISTKAIAIRMRPIIYFFDGCFDDSELYFVAIYLGFFGQRFNLFTTHRCICKHRSIYASMAAKLETIRTMAAPVLSDASYVCVCVRIRSLLLS